MYALHPARRCFLRPPLHVCACHCLTQVFLIAAREFLDFAVFLFYILVLLGSAVFAFFQLTGGNYQFLRFPDGLSLMTRLTFGEFCVAVVLLVTTSRRATGSLSV